MAAMISVDVNRTLRMPSLPSWARGLYKEKNLINSGSKDIKHVKKIWSFRM